MAPIGYHSPIAPIWPKMGYFGPYRAIGPLWPIRAILEVPQATFYRRTPPQHWPSMRPAHHCPVRVRVPTRHRAAAKKRPQKPMQSTPQASCRTRCGAVPNKPCVGTVGAWYREPTLEAPKRVLFGVTIGILAVGPYVATGTLPKRVKNRPFLTLFGRVPEPYLLARAVAPIVTPKKGQKRAIFGPIWPQLGTIAQ